MAQIPSKVLDLVQRLKDGKQPNRQTPRKILKWFGAAKRGEKIIAEIADAFRLAGIRTSPEFTEVGIDEPVRLLLVEKPIPQAPTAPQPSPDETHKSNLTETTEEYETSANVLEPEPEVDEEPSGAVVEDVTVLSQPHDWTISTLDEKYKKGKLNLQAAYQREYVWKLRPELPSRLIESLLLEIPIPPLYFGKMMDGALEVIDGQQRLTTLIEFVRNQFPLRKLQRRKDINGRYFKDLSETDQTKISDATIRSVVIDARNNADLRYEVFERLNRGSMALNEQELRNCVYRGPFNDMMVELEKDLTWRKVKGGQTPDPRFIEREMILRFFAFANRQPFYAGNLKRFLNEYMGSYAPSTPDQLKQQAAMFRDAMRNVYTVFGDAAGRLYTVNGKTNNGAWETKFSIAALDIQASALVRQSPAKVQAKAEQIREQFLFLLLTDGELQGAISKQTGSTASTTLRWTRFRSIVQPMLDGTQEEPRFFDYAFRDELFKQSRKCALCGNEIHVFQDSTVDHIHPYSKGGKTVPKNGQLAHRACNARKNAKIEAEANAQN